MPWTADDLARVEKAIAHGQQTVRHSDGKQVTYRDASELLKVRDRIKAEMEALATPSTGWPAFRRLVQTQSGLASSRSAADD